MQRLLGLFAGAVAGAFVLSGCGGGGGAGPMAPAARTGGTASNTQSLTTAAPGHRVFYGSEFPIDETIVNAVDPETGNVTTQIVGILGDVSQLDYTADGSRVFGVVSNFHIDDTISNNIFSESFGGGPPSQQTVTSGLNIPSFVAAAFNATATTAYVLQSGPNDPSHKNPYSIAVVDVAANTVTSTFSIAAAFDAALGQNFAPLGTIILSPDGHTLYLNAAAGGSSAVFAIDIATQRVTHAATLPGGTLFGFNGIAVTPDGKTVIAPPTSGNVVFLDASTLKVLASVHTGSAPRGVALGVVSSSCSGAPVYVTDSVDGTLTVIDSLSHNVVHTLALGGKPLGVAVDHSGIDVYVAADTYLAIVNPNTFAVRKIPNPITPVPQTEPALSMGKFAY